MKFRLRTRLSLSYVLVALILVGMISILSNVFLERQFREYIITKQEATNENIVSMIQQQYNSKDNTWNTGAIESIGINALEQGLIIKVTDKEGHTVWDATIHNSGLCSQMLDHMSRNMASRYPDFQGKYVESSYRMILDPSQTGNVYIGYYGPFYFTDNELAFINTLNKILVLVALFSLLLALLAGTFTAKRFSKPISEAVATAREIGRGNYNIRIDEKSNTEEIDELTATINDLAQNLNRQEKLRRRLTGDMAHELRTPMATLQSHMEAMIDGIWEADSARLKSCHDEIVRINRMVGDLENLARYESESLVLNKGNFDLTELLQTIINNFQAEFHKKNVHLGIKGETCPIFADRDKIAQLIINLLSNALKYSLNGGKVEVTARLLQEQAELKIRDNGIGIDPEDLPHIFERFYRADKSRNRITGGSGVGLAIAKAIAEAHGGQISVTSAVNKGTEFTVSLPRFPS